MAKYVSDGTWAVVDAGTGEVMTGVIEDGDIVTITKAGSRNVFKRLSEESVELNKGRSFVKVFPDTADRLARRLNGAELWMTYAIIPYISVNSGILQHGNKQFLTRAHLLEIYDGVQSRSNIDRAIHGLVAKGILAKCTISGKVAYIANPYIFHRGSRANATLLTLFKGAGWN